MTRQRSTVAITAVTVAFAAYALAVALGGGFALRLGGLRVRSHSWGRPAAVAAIGMMLLGWRHRGALARFLPRAWSSLDTPATARVLSAVALGWTAVAALTFGAFAVGGSDSYGYASQARLFAQGRLTDRIPLAGQFSWPDVNATLTPLAYTEAARSDREIAPTYPPGLPLLMAPLVWSDRAVHLIVPLFGLVAVWFTYRLGVVLGDGLAGGVAALLLSLSPTFLFHLVQPLSDVPAAACWIAALVVGTHTSRQAAAASGAIVALAILVRPNLAPLSCVIGMAVARESEHRWSRIAAFAAPLTVGLVLLGAVQAVRYGSPLSTGYGRLEELFSTANVVPNLERYPGWLTETHTPFIWLWLAAPLWIARQPRPAIAWVAWVLSLAVWALYLPYGYFGVHEWFYTRFLLPAIPIMLLFSAVILLGIVRRRSMAVRAPSVVVVLVVLGTVLAASARAHGVFEVRRQEQKYPEAARFVRERLPASTVVLAVQHSGSIRYYADRPTIRWDRIDPAHLGDVLAALGAKGFTPVLVADAGEDVEFRNRFGSPSLTPIGEFGAARVYSFGAPDNRR